MKNDLIPGTALNFGPLFAIETVLGKSCEKFIQKTLLWSPSLFYYIANTRTLRSEYISEYFEIYPRYLAVFYSPFCTRVTQNKRENGYGFEFFFRPPANRLHFASLMR